MTAAAHSRKSWSPSAWRGHAAAGSAAPPVLREGKRGGTVFHKIGREVMEHPAETAALVVMGIALSRILRRPCTGKRAFAENPRGRRGVLPLSVMAALCILGLSA